MESFRLHRSLPPLSHIAVTGTVCRGTGYTLQTPPPMIPNDIRLGVLLQRSKGKCQISVEEVVHLFWGPTVRITLAMRKTGRTWTHELGKMPETRISLR